MTTIWIVAILIVAGGILLGGAYSIAKMLHELNKDNDINIDYDED